MVIYVAETIDTNTDVLYGNGQGNVSFVKWFKVMGQTWQADLARYLLKQWVQNSRYGYGRCSQQRQRREFWRCVNFIRLFCYEFVTPHQRHYRFLSPSGISNAHCWSSPIARQLPLFLDCLHYPEDVPLCIR